MQMEEIEALHEKRQLGRLHGHICRLHSSPRLCRCAPFMLYSRQRRLASAAAAAAR